MALSKGRGKKNANVQYRVQFWMVEGREKGKGEGEKGERRGGGIEPLPVTSIHFILTQPFSVC